MNSSSDFKKNKELRGCFIFLGVVLCIAAFGGITQLTLPYFGNLSFLAGLGALLIVILLWIGLAKGARWARLVMGILLLILGLAVSVFIIYDFITSLIKGQSILRTEAISAGNYGQSAFIVLAVGVAMLGGGVMLLQSLKKNP
jgi:hypothetical protein